MASKQARRTLVKRYLKANPLATNEQVAKALHVSARLVTLARAELALDGTPVRAASDYTSAFSKIEDTEIKSLETQGAKAFMDAASLQERQIGRPLTLEEQVEILSRLIRDPMASPQTVGGLITVLQRIKPDTKNQIGPRDPLSFEDKVKRLSLLIQACGLEVTQVALRSAGFGGQITTLERKSSAQDQKIPPDPGASPLEYVQAGSGESGRDPLPGTAGAADADGGSEGQGQGGSE